VGEVKFLVDKGRGESIMRGNERKCKKREGILSLVGVISLPLTLIGSVICKKEGI